MLGRRGGSCIEILENSNRTASEKTSLIIGKPLKPPQMSMTSAMLRTRWISKHKLDKRRHRKEAAAWAQRAEPWLELQRSSHSRIGTSAHGNPNCIPMRLHAQTASSLRTRREHTRPLTETNGPQTDPTARRLPASVTSALPWQC